VVEVGGGVVALGRHRRLVVDPQLDPGVAGELPLLHLDEMEVDPGRVLLGVVDPRSPAFPEDEADVPHSPPDSA